MDTKKPPAVLRRFPLILTYDPRLFLPRPTATTDAPRLVQVLMTTMLRPDEAVISFSVLLAAVQWKNPGLYRWFLENRRAICDEAKHKVRAQKPSISLREIPVGDLVPVQEATAEQQEQMKQGEAAFPLIQAALRSPQFLDLKRLTGRYHRGTPRKLRHRPEQIADAVPAWETYLETTDTRPARDRDRDPNLKHLPKPLRHPRGRATRHSRAQRILAFLCHVSLRTIQRCCK